MIRVLVTGGAGFIGSNLVDALLARGDAVRVLDNLSTGSRDNLAHARQQIEWIEGDLCDPGAVERAVQGVETIFHQAALASVPRSVAQPLETHAACATGTLNLLHAASRAGARRLVYAASSSAYGNLDAASKRETDLPRPISPYAAAKLAGEMYCQAFAAMGAIETVALRYFNVFGPRQDPRGEYSAVIPKFITAMLAEQQPLIYGDGRQSRDFTFVANVVQANLKAADTPGVSGRVYNAATGHQITLLQLVEELNRLLGTSIAPKLAPPRVGDVRDSLADISQARRELGYQAEVDLAEGLRRSIDYYVGISRQRAASSR